MLHTLIQVLLILKQSGLRFFKSKYYVRSSALAFTSLLGFIPLVSVLVSLLSKLPITASMLPKLQHFVFNNFVPTQGEKIYPFIEKFLAQADRLPLTQFFFLIFISMFLLLSIERTLNHIWGLGRKRKISVSLLLTWGVLILAPIFMVLSIIISTYLISLPILVRWNVDIFYHHYFAGLLPFFSSFLAFALLYFVIPCEKVKLVHALFGGLVATLLFEAAKHVFSIYVKLFPTYDAIYGAMAVIPIFMLWVYLVWCIVIYGAIVVSQCSSKFTSSKSSK